MEEGDVLWPDQTLHPEVDTAATPEPDYEEGDLRQVAPSRAPGMRVNPHQVRRIPTARERKSPLRPAMAPRTSIESPSPIVVPPQPALPLVIAASSLKGVFAGVIGLMSVAMFSVALVIPLFVGEQSISLLGASVGQGNSFIVIGVAVAALIGSVLLLLSRRSAPMALWGGLACVISGVAATGLTFYLVSLTAHREMVARGYDYGPGMWLLVAGFSLCLVAGIIGLVRGTSARIDI